MNLQAGDKDRQPQHAGEISTLNRNSTHSNAAPHAKAVWLEDGAGLRYECGPGLCLNLCVCLQNFGGQT